jgi:hypothetical protein
MGHWIRQFTCPKCGVIGAGHPQHLPLCHLCDYKVQMLPSHNGVIYEQWEELHKLECEQIKGE